MTYDPPPEHYTSADGSITPWAIWDAFDMDPWTANAVKYLCRAGKKPNTPRIDDLRKAANCIGYLIEREEERAQEPWECGDCNGMVPGADDWCIHCGHASARRGGGLTYGNSLTTHGQAVV